MSDFPYDPNFQLLEDINPKPIKGRKIRNKSTEHRRTCYICGLRFEDEPVQIKCTTCKISICINCKSLVYPIRS